MTLQLKIARQKKKLKYFFLMWNVINNMIIICNTKYRGGAHETKLSWWF